MTHTRLFRRPLSLAGLCLVAWLATLPAHAVETASFEIVAREGKLAPETLEVPAGARLKLTLRNLGKAPVEFESKELRIEKVLGPNASTVVTVPPLKPGRYKLVDEFHEATSQMLVIAK